MEQITVSGRNPGSETALKDFSTFTNVKEALSPLIRCPINSSSFGCSPRSKGSLFLFLKAAIIFFRGKNVPSEGSPRAPAIAITSHGSISTVAILPQKFRPFFPVPRLVSWSSGKSNSFLFLYYVKGDFIPLHSMRDDLV